MKKNIFTLFACAVFFVAATAQKIPATATEIVNATVAKAKQQHKKALVMFHASWCQWCKKWTHPLMTAPVKNISTIIS